MGFAAVGAENGLFQTDAGDLVGHLVVLMSPHIGSDGGGERIVRQLFQTIRPDGILREGIQHFVGVHRFRNAAELGTLNGREPGQAFVAGEVTDRGAVVCKQLVEHEFGEGVVDLAVFQNGGKTARLDGHALVYHVGFLTPYVFGLFVGPVGIETFVVHALLLQKASEIQQPFFGVHFVDGEDRDQAFKPSGVRPCENGVLLDVSLEVLEGLVDHFGNPFVTGAVVVEHQHLVDQVQCPHIVAAAFLIGAGAEPAVFLLTGNDGVDEALCTGDLVLVVEEVSQRDEAVQPVGHSFPALAVTAHPAAVADIRPDFVEVAREAFRLNFQLTPEPTGSLQFRGSVEFQFVHENVSFRNFI